MHGEGVAHVVQARLVAGVRGLAYDNGAGSQTAKCHLSVLSGHRLTVVGNKKGRCGLGMLLAVAWLRFLGILRQPPAGRRGIFDKHVDAFIAHLRDERGLSPRTIYSRRWQIDGFLEYVSSSKASIASITADDIECFLESKGRKDWCRVSVATCAIALRSFFRYAERRGWCSSGIAAAIDSPRLFKQEVLPRGPLWTDIQRLIDSTIGSGPRDIRDHAILMLLAVYGFRSGEVRSLRREDLLAGLRDVAAFGLGGLS